MSISILNRGASGGLKPELTVTAPSGSTIDLIKNGIIVATYALGANETKHTFVVKIGTYTARGTLGASTKSVDVVIDTIGQYTVKIEYKLWLYREGDECEEVTGGWEKEGGGDLVKNADHMIVTYYGATQGVRTVNRGIPNPEYKKFCAEVKAEQAYFDKGNFKTGFSSSSGTILWQSIDYTGYYTQTIDISSLVGQTFGVGFYGQYYSQATGSIYIKNVWLE